MVHTQRHQSITEERTVGEKKGISGNEREMREGYEGQWTANTKLYMCENVIMKQHCTEYVQLIYSNKKLKLQKTRQQKTEEPEA